MLISPTQAELVVFVLMTSGKIVQNLHASSDNGQQNNWEITMGKGSPGAANQYYLTSRIQAKRELWMQIGAALGVIFLCLILLFLRSRRIL